MKNRPRAGAPMFPTTVRHCDGRYEEETQRLIREAIKLHLDRLRVEGRQPTRQDSPRPITNTP